MESKKRNILFSPSSLDAAEDCMRKLKFSHVENKSAFEKAAALERGSMMHRMLEVHYTGKKEKKEYGAVIQAAVQAGREYAINSSIEIELSERVIDTYMKYADYYRSERFEILEVEKAVIFPAYEDEEIRIFFQLKTDLVVRIDGVENPIPWDHKSVEKKGHFGRLSNQFAMTALAWGSSIVVVNEVGMQKTKAPHEKFKKHHLSYPKPWLDDWLMWTIHKIKEIDFRMQAGVYPPNFRSCFYCTFRTVCESTPDNRQNKLDTLFAERERFDLFPAEEIEE